MIVHLLRKLQHAGGLSHHVDVSYFKISLIIEKIKKYGIYKEANSINFQINIPMEKE